MSSEKFLVGDFIRILNKDGQYAEWARECWRITDISYSSREHQGYDSAMNGMGLISCDGLPVSLYEYEIEKV